MNRYQALQVILKHVALDLKNSKMKSSDKLKQAHDILTRYLDQAK